MKTENAVLMQMAKQSLKGKWSTAIAVFLTYLVILFAANLGLGFLPFGDVATLLSSVTTCLLVGPFMLGLAIFFLSVSRNENVSVNQLFQGFDRFGTAFGAYFLTTLFSCLWALLLIVPGIIAAISYAMTFYILADDHSIGVMDAIRKSKTMMKGYKWKFVCLQLRFVGWFLLCILTLGIGFLWLFPYAQTSIAKFYDDLKPHNLIENA
jgi:uncharacterized membrane protein